MIDRYAFLDPWTLLLPTAPGAVIGVAGTGGKSTLLRRLWRHYRARGDRVLCSQTAWGPPWGDEPVHTPDADPRLLAGELDGKGTLTVAGPHRAGGCDGIEPRDLEALRGRLSPDVTLVEAHAATGTPLRGDDRAPVWPEPVHLGFLVGSLGAVGRLWGPATVAGAETPTRDAGGEPRRVTVDDVLAAYDVSGPLISTLPASCAPVPFLTGFGAFRDMDGMFALVERLWSVPRVRLVCLAELLGDERRDAADLRDIPAATDALAGERVYALYPAALDETD